MNMMSTKLLTILGLVFCLSLCGALIFIKGFLLSRTVVNTKSSCEVDFSNKVDDHFHHGMEGCWMHGRFKKAVIVIIDALKYEFAQYNESVDHKSSAPFQNKLTSFHHLLENKPLHSRLFRFLADPPTTTMQRLKGLTTGSLPTFVDAGTNFQSYEISEDNIIDQLLSSDKKIKFFGDDTWLGLFPNRFYKAYDFPSFNVKDLHTVDNGILSNIYPEMRRSDWDVIIAHFLGVDHCGHRYGPNHPAMAEKLTQMNAVLSNITSLLSDDTILFVMGDHGMTRTGDHGGDSADELEAALFVYSPARLFPEKKSQGTVVKQTDFVPTFSLLLGLPIPFSNLGMVIPELFSHCPWWDTQTNDIRRIYHKVKALRLNAYQVETYLDAYSLVSGDLRPGKLKELKQQLAKTESILQGLLTNMIANGASGDSLRQFKSVEQMYISYIQSVRAMCEGVWAKFDLVMIALGLMTILVSALLCLYFLIAWKEGDDGDGSEEIPLAGKIYLGLGFLHIVYSGVHMTMLPDTVPPVMAFVLSSVLIVAILIQLCQWNLIKSAMSSLSVSNGIASVLLFLYCCIYFSNSFIVQENAVVLFFLQTLICAFGVQIMTKKFLTKRDHQNVEFSRMTKKPKSHYQGDILQVLSSPLLVLTYLILVSSILLRLSSNFWVCREEQHKCEDSMFTLPLSNVKGNDKNLRYIFSIVCVAIQVLVVRFWLRFYGNLNGSSPGVIAIKYAPPLAVIFMSLHWALQAVPDLVLDSFPLWQQVLMAQIVYVVILLAFVALISSPLLIYTLLTQSTPGMQLPHHAGIKHVIPSLYNQLKVRLSENRPGEEVNEKPPMVYGLGSVYNASIVTLLSLVSLLLVLLLNSGMAPSMLIATLTLVSLLELFSTAVISERGENTDSHSCFSWSGVVMLNLASSLYFYSTGHQATIPSIRFEAAYTGFYGDFSTMVLPGSLIWLNTFAGPVFFSLATPLLIFWPALSSLVVRWILNPNKEQSSWQGDFKLYNDGNQLKRELFKLCCATILAATLKMGCAAAAAALHRRHLMVWKIFAPRFVYEGAMFLTVSVFSILAFAFVLRVDLAISTFLKSLPSKKQS